jgi:quercetin dioxygenase-like cupin family protein
MYGSALKVRPRSNTEARMSFDFWHSRLDVEPLKVPAIGLEVRVRLPPSATGGELAIIETRNEPGSGPPLHRHPETEIFRVLEGRYLFEVDGKRFHAEAGDVVSVPGGVVHTFVNVADTPSRQLVVFAPGLDATAFFTGLGAATKDGINKAALDAFAAKWGIEFLGPPLKPE